MLRELMYKWFGIDPIPCAACEVLKESLSIERQLNKVLMTRLLDKGSAEPPPPPTEEFKSIQPQFIPWRVRQQMLEAEDRKRAQLTADKQKEISKLEEELGVSGS